MRKNPVQEDIVDAIINDLEDRKGLGNEWEAIDDDIQIEIRNTWLDLVLKELRK